MKSGHMYSLIWPSSRWGNHQQIIDSIIMKDVIMRTKSPSLACYGVTMMNLNDVQTLRVWSSGEWDLFSSSWLIGRGRRGLSWAEPREVSRRKRVCGSEDLGPRRSLGTVQGQECDPSEVGHLQPCHEQSRFRLATKGDNGKCGQWLIRLHSTTVQNS